MGFFNTVGKAAMGVGKSVCNSIQEKEERIMRAYDEMYDWDDEKVIRRYRSSDQEKKLAAIKILKERGYTKEDLG